MFLNGFPELVAKVCTASGLFSPMSIGLIERETQPYDRGHVFGPPAAPRLLTAAKLLEGDRCALADIEHANGLGSIELMRGERQQVNAQVFDAQRQKPCCLDRIGMEGHRMLLR